VSKARLVITAVVVEGRSQSEVAREYVVSQGWISRLVARYRREGQEAFEPRSRRPLTSPTRLPQPTIELTVTLRNDLLSKGLDHGPHTIAWHLRHHHGLTVSVNSIHRHLRAAGLVTPTPQRRPKSSYIRFAAEQPNERWQADFTHWWLADGTHVEILDWIDDHARYALSVTAHRRVTGHIVLARLAGTTPPWGQPSCDTPNMADSEEDALLIAIDVMTAWAVGEDSVAAPGRVGVGGDAAAASRRVADYLREGGITEPELITALINLSGYLLARLAADESDSKGMSEWTEKMRKILQRHAEAIELR